MNQQICIRTGQDNGHEISLAQVLSTLNVSLGASHPVGREYSARELHEAFFGGDKVPKSFEVCGIDGFHALIPWRCAENSIFRFPDAPNQNESSGGLRLFVRGSENACLNVKSVADIHFDYQDDLDQPMFARKLP